MRKLVFAIMAIFLLLGVSSNVTAQNPVKKVKYLKHKYEGEVGKKKVPNGKGTMTFEGFTVTGDFQGNEVTNATLSINNSDISYKGNLSFDESQNVTLKPGGKIQAIVYPMNSLWDFGDYLRGGAYEFETISSDKLVNIDDFNNISEFDVSFTDPVEWKDEIKLLLDPPAITESFLSKAKKVRIRYEEKGPTTILDWKLLSDDSSYSFDDKTQYIFVQRGNPEKHLTNVDGYKDDKGRTWTCKGNYIKVVYPNGSYIDLNVLDITKGVDRYELGQSYNFKIFRPSNIVISNDYACGKCEFYNSDNIIVAHIGCDIGVGKDLEKVLALMDTTRLLHLGGNPVIYDSENISEKDIENILNHQVFPNFKIEESDGSSFSYWGVTLPSNLEHLMFKKMIRVFGIIGEEKSIIGYYLLQERKYLSKSQLEGDVNREEKKNFDRLLAQLNPFIKRFGFNPLERRGLKDIVKVGTSFKLISNYCKLTEKYCYCSQGKEESFKRVFPGEEFLYFGRLRELAIEKKINLEGYYYTRLSIDHGIRKCYDIRYWDVFHRDESICYVWVSGDRITSVSWY